LAVTTVWSKRNEIISRSRARISIPPGGLAMHDRSGDSKRQHVFISHHHKDDSEVTKMTALLNRHGHDIRNSSIRAKPANQKRLDRGLVKDDTIRRLLRMKISWASCVVVLVGKETHSRPWVNWEIKEANRQGKRIVGVYVRGGKESDAPKNLNLFGDALVGWDAEAITDAIHGKNTWCDPDGTPRQSPWPVNRSRC